MRRTALMEQMRCPMSDSDSESIATGKRGASTPRLERINLASTFASRPPPLDFIWPGFLAGTVGMLASPGGSGKSMWALEALCAQAGGEGADLLGIHPPAQGRAVYLCLEDPALVLQHRLYAIGQLINPEARERVTESLDVFPACGRALNLLEPRQRDGLARALEGVRVTVIDTLSRAHQADENSNAQMAQLVSGLEWICERTGAAILLLHHSRKGGAGDGGEAQHSARGASALVDNARWAATLNRMSEIEAETMADAEHSLDPLLPTRVCERRGFYVRFDASKVNYAPPSFARWYRREEGGVLVPARLEYLPNGAKSGGAPASKAVPWRGRPGRE